MTRKITGLPYTVARLIDIEPGAEIVYYRGNFDSDLANTSFHQAPTYRELLAKVRDIAERLQREGRVRLEERPIHRTDHRYVEYIAIGLAT